LLSEGRRTTIVDIVVKCYFFAGLNGLDCTHGQTYFATYNPFLSSGVWVATVIDISSEVPLLRNIETVVLVQGHKIDFLARLFVLVGTALELLLINNLSTKLHYQTINGNVLLCFEAPSSTRSQEGFALGEFLLL